MKWQTGNPPDHGYYLAAWRYVGVGDSRYYVSELWFNPSTGWFPSRGYLGGRDDDYDFMYKRKEVVAWSPMPKYPVPELPDHDLNMAHFYNSEQMVGCPPNCPRKLAKDRQ